MDGSFRALGEKYVTDKVNVHGYQRFYPQFLEHLRGQEMRMLEIGAHDGGSLNLWLDYFPKGKIYGIDIKKESVYPRGKVFCGDQGNRAFLDSVIEDIGGELDFVIDDGSHVPEHQVLGLNAMFATALKPGGIYIIEDIETSYFTGGIVYGNAMNYGYQHPDSAITLFKEIVDSVNWKFVSDEARQQFTSPVDEAVRSQISTMTFAQNCIILVKKDATSQPYDTGEYKFKSELSRPPSYLCYVWVQIAEEETENLLEDATCSFIGGPDQRMKSYLLGKSSDGANMFKVELPESGDLQLSISAAGRQPRLLSFPCDPDQTVDLGTVTLVAGDAESGDIERLPEPAKYSVHRELRAVSENRGRRSTDRPVTKDEKSRR